MEEGLTLKSFRWSFIPEARTRITAIAISSSMLAALGSGRCHVWTLKTGDRYSIRLPSATWAEYFAVSGETLAYAHIIDWGEASSRVEVVTWTLKNQRTSSFSVAVLCNDGSFDFTTMLDEKGESLILFEMFPNYYPEVVPTRLHCTRATLDGIILTEDVIEVPDIRDYKSCTVIGEYLNKETNGQAVIWSGAKHHHGTDDISTLMLISYNLQKDRLEVRKHVVAGFRSNRQGKRYGLEFHWKDAACFPEFENNRLNLMVIDLQQSICSKAKMDFPADDPASKESNGLSSFRFGDEMFLICVYAQGFSVWCFDPIVQLFNEDIAYKEQRKSNMDRRLRLKRD